MSLIKLIDVTKTYPAGSDFIFALNHINLNIEKGEMVALMGRSGSGKTTAANIVGLLDDPTSGKYFLDEVDMSNLSISQQAKIRNEKIGFVFQSFFLLARLKAWENVALPLIYRGYDRAQAYEKVIAIFNKLGISELKDKKPNQMSGGQQQRIAIARALVGNPAIIIADEPTGALDVHTSKQIIQLLSDLHRESKITILIVTHDPGVGAECQRILVMSDGKIIIDEMNKDPGKNSISMVSKLLVSISKTNDTAVAGGGR